MCAISPFFAAFNCAFPSFLQTKSRAATALTRLVEDDLVVSRQRQYEASTRIWPPNLLKGAGGGEAGANSRRNSGTGIDGRRVSKKEAATVLLVRDGDIAVTQGGVTRTVVPGESVTDVFCICIGLQMCSK